MTAVDAVVGGGGVGVGGTAAEDGTVAEAVGVGAGLAAVAVAAAVAAETGHCTCAASSRLGWVVGVLGRAAAIRTVSTCMPSRVLTGHVTMGRL